jgi:hypothetical protein
MSRLAVVLCFLVTCLSGTVAADQPGALNSQPSVLEIPFRLPLDKMLAQVEQLLPEQAGHWHGWTNWNGVNAQYRAWRGRLGYEFRGDTLTLYAHVRYWVKAHKRLFGVNLSGDCGIDEPPRQALIGVQMRFLWSQDWTLQPLFQLLPTRFFDRCEMTVADIDVTPVVEQVFRDQMKQSLRHAMAVLNPAMRQVRTHAERAWDGLQQPLALGDQAQLLLDPLGMSLAPLELGGDHAGVTLGVLLQPAVRLGRQQSMERRPLPALMPFRPTPEGMRFQINLALDYDLLSSSLTTALKGRDLQFEGRRIDILSAAVGGKERELSVKLSLGGDASGDAEIWTNLVFEPESGQLRLDELNFIFEPRSDDLFLAVNLFHERIRQTLQSVANGWLQDATTQFNRRLRETMERIAPPGTRLNPDELSITRLDFAFDPNGLKMRGTARGSVGIRFAES